MKKSNQSPKEEEIIDYYYNPNVECTCEAIFADTHRIYCKRRVRPKSNQNPKEQSDTEDSYSLDNVPSKDKIVPEDIQSPQKGVTETEVVPTESNLVETPRPVDIQSPKEQSISETPNKKQNVPAGTIPKETEEEIEKVLNFHNSHNIMTSQPKGVMAVSEAKKLAYFAYSKAKEDEMKRVEELIDSKNFQEEIRDFFKYLWQLSPHNFDFKIKEDSPDDIVKNFIEFKLKQKIKENRR